MNIIYILYIYMACNGALIPLIPATKTNSPPRVEPPRSKIF